VGRADLTGVFPPNGVSKWVWKGALEMPKKWFGAGQIVTLLRQIEVSMALGNGLLG
jgi:hypothetical protein